MSSTYADALWPLIPENISTTAAPVISNAKAIACDVSSFWSNKLYHHLFGPSNPKAYYNHLLQVATNYEQWAEAASLLDDLEGLDAWKQDPRSPDYDWELVQTRLHQLQRVRETTQSQSAMIFALRTSLGRNLGDIGNPKLYSHTRIGTKALISSYIEEVVRQLNWICDEPSPELDLRAKHEFFMTIRQSFGRTALLLSGGGTLGLNHLGVLKCLHSARLLPRIISGASSGSIMAAMLCTKTDEEIPHLFNPAGIQLDVFERKGQPDTPIMRIHRLLSKGQLYDAEILQDAMRSNLGDITFQEAFNRTRWILNITVSSSTVYDMPRLLNYLTAPDVLIWSAVAVSCSVPVFYGSSPLYAKDKNGNIVPWNPNDQLYIDGSVDNDLPMNKLSELFNVNHFIVCQVNPHVIPFLQKSSAPSRTRKAANFCMHMAKMEMQHRCTQLTELGVAPSFFNKVQSIMSQKYSGDITIIPDIGYGDFLKVLSNPTDESVIEAIIRGEQATWPKISIIKNHLQIELTIDAILYRLRLKRLAELPYNPSTSTPLNSTRPALENRAASHLDIPRARITSIVKEEEQRRSLEMERERRSTKRGLAMTATNKD
ncbi:patatin family [Lichtheimia corymbifera JMRC:FSU:9682]|uniref:Patatin family n=1 Tax=Lichtheimia corymbifera JMRC:FSU:9682 TaxID=1263082 RepID=A0A068S3Y4_9FUNG|nr:patatin family [Lichtheimia corymbifera JMRC:FSU:9682]